MYRFSLPSGYTRFKSVAKPKLGSLLPVIDRILAENYVAPVNQRHTAKRIFEQLRDEHGYGGGCTVVKDYVRRSRVRSRETFVALAHPPRARTGDFGEAVGVIGDVRQKAHFFCMDVPQSDACFVKAYPSETMEAFLDGHVCAFAFFGWVRLSILYDKTRIAVAKICGDGKGNDEGKVEELVKCVRSHFMVPIPRTATYDDFDAELERRCRARQEERAGHHTETIGERLAADLAGDCQELRVQKRLWCRLNEWRRIATRYDKLATNYMAGVFLAATIIFWCN